MHEKCTKMRPVKEIYQKYLGIIEADWSDRLSYQYSQKLGKA